MFSIEQFNADWLAAWSDNDVERVLSFYDAEASYKDPQVPDGISGHSAMRDYFIGLFASLPATRYTPDATWPIPGGFCGRWYCDVAEGAGGRLRGSDLVLMRGDRIALNEVYVHQLATA